MKAKSINKIGVLGAGLMGHGIAYVSASSGFEVVLVDTSDEQLEKAKNSINAILTNQLKNEQILKSDFEKTLKRLHTSIDYNLLKNCDLIIEAVNENVELKEKVISSSGQFLSNNGTFASNTSTIPISLLAEAANKPEHFIGLHFFSPVHKMKLVEIIKGEKTNQGTLSLATEFVRKINKEPIIVNDGPGFFTTRVFQCFTNEGMSMLYEGLEPALIETIAKKAGYPIGPLAILDEININLASHINSQILKYSGGKIESSPSSWENVMNIMISKLKRTGRSSGSGFYEYPKNNKKYLWPKLSEYFPVSGSKFEEAYLIDRFYFSQGLETIRCFEEGIIASSSDANTGSLLGWGFPSKTGGILNFINNYGLSEFKKRANELEQLFGKRFRTPRLLEKMIVSKTTF